MTTEPTLESAPGAIPSGEWAGYYVQGGKHRQRMSLQFRDGRVSGDGDDEVGRFHVSGHYDDDGVVTCVKSYPGRHQVTYRGFWEKASIWGTWSIGANDRGGFRIWPRGRGAGFEKELEETREVERVAEVPRSTQPRVGPTGAGSPGDR